MTRIYFPVRRHAGDEGRFVVFIHEGKKEGQKAKTEIRKVKPSTPEKDMTISTKNETETLPNQKMN